MARQEMESGFAERSFGITRNVGIVIGIIGLVSNPGLLVLGAGMGLGGEVGRRNRESARKKK
ncbi:MAG: hypothetical protein Q7K55_02670 [Candidatus Levybacteria bacterium]|nr:hypothetical protein [Candidatus Levybacteria bacterium]